MTKSHLIKLYPHCNPRNLILLLRALGVRLVAVTDIFRVEIPADFAAILSPDAVGETAMAGPTEAIAMAMSD